MPLIAMPMTPSSIDQAKELLADIADMQDFDKDWSEEVILHVANWLADCYNAGAESQLTLEGRSC